MTTSHDEYSTIGKSVLRTDALAKVTGSAIYPADLALEDALHMTTLFADRPHARVAAVDTAAAESAPGVVMVLTARDVPLNLYGLQIKDQPVLCGPGSDQPGADIVRCVGDRIALVIAETEVQARAAASLIAIEWEDLPLVVDPEEAAPALAGGLDARPAGEPHPVPIQLHMHSPDNVTASYRIRKGSAAAAMASAEIVVEGIYQTPWQEHVFLQPEAGAAYLDEEGRVVVAVAGQWTHEDQKEIAHALGLPVEQVRVVYPAIGGAFGGREDMSVQITLALSAWRLAQQGIRRPVKTVWTREESIIGHGKRHPMKIYARWGARRDGMLVAAQVKVIADGGAYCYTSNKVLGNTTLTCTGPYEIPNVAVDTYAIYTNNLPSCAFRGFGGPQGTFAAECQMDRLAEALGMDPVELRLKNVLTEDKLLTTGTPIPGGVGLTETITTAARAAGWTQDAEGHWHKPVIRDQGSTISDQRSATGYHSSAISNLHSPIRTPQSAIRNGVGFACGFKNVGFSFGYPENCWAKVELRGEAEIEEAIVYCAAADCGQGNHTVLAQVAAETLALPFERVRVVASDTAIMANSGSASASRLTHLSGNAVRGAAEAAYAVWCCEERPASAEYVYLAPKTTRLDPETGYGMPNFAYGYAAEVAQVAVDTETGQVRVQRFICADDVGQAINPQSVVGQIQGGAVQALGYALLEDFRMSAGRVLTGRLSTYLIPTVLDVPESFDALLAQVPDPRGPFGARGMGEMPYLPAAAAVANALRDATGIRFDEFPLIPQRVLAKLLERPAP
jgi:CO/xanthine dehydrogenase Mo-binding subunit